MSARQYIVVVDDDATIADAMAMLLEREGRTVFLCSDVESAEIVLARYPVTHVLSDVQFSGPFGFEGLHFLARMRVQRPQCRIVLMTGLVNPAFDTVAVGVGAAAVLAKPFTATSMEAALAIEDGDEAPYELVRMPALDEVLSGGMLGTVFQPLVTLDAKVFGFEALARVRGGWAGGGIAELFEYASKRNRLPDLNLVALDAAVREAGKLPKGTALFINVDPLTFDGGRVVNALRESASRNDFSLSRIVLEITERSGFMNEAAAVRAFDELRGEGVRFALDDHGSAYSHLRLIDHIRPSFVKISSTFGTAFEEDPVRMRVVRHIVALARDFGCRTVLEGIETASTALAAAAYGVDLAQGYHFGRPSEASHWLDATLLAA